MTTSQNFIEIEDIVCRYPNTQTSVLNIDKLEIPRGKITFILGPSGVGKTTLLETLGLMNNTIAPDCNGSVKYFLENNQEYSAFDLWKSQRNLNTFRADNLSFIFQNTNLIPSLSSLENILITQYVKNISKSIALNRSRKKIDEIFGTDLEETRQDLKYGSRKTNALSGGQKQRLAFVRAIVNESQLVLADEPTGNLDIKNADNVMAILVQQIREKKSTAIIVSHDFNLATKHGDFIVRIKYEKLENTHGYGKIDDTSFFSKRENKWFHGTEECSEDQLVEILK